MVQHESLGANKEGGGKDHMDLLACQKAINQQVKVLALSSDHIP